MKNEPWRGDGAARDRHLEEKLANKKRRLAEFQNEAVKRKAYYEERIAELKDERDEARRMIDDAIDAMPNDEALVTDTVVDYARNCQDRAEKAEAERDEERAMRKYAEGRRRELEAERDEARSRECVCEPDWDVQALLGPLEAEIARLRKERDEHIEASRAWMREMIALKAEVARLREALADHLCVAPCSYCAALAEAEEGE